MNQTSTNKLTVPAAIIVAGFLIAGAIYLTQGGAASPSGTATNTPEKEIKMRPVGDSDHILGNPNADIIIVEYSDTECPFCKQFHKTLETIMDEYGKDGKVAWVYRHFPLAQLHSKAPHEAEALECASEVGGKSAFWDYANKIYEVTPSNDGLDPAMLYTIADGLKLDHKAFATCLESGKYKAKVQADYDDAVASGGQGTPHSIIITKKGDKLPLEGAQPLASVKSIIESLLKAN